MSAVEAGSGERLQQLRKVLRLDHGHMGLLLGCAPQTVELWEDGRPQPHEPRLGELTNSLRRESVDMTFSRAIELVAESGTAERFLQQFSDPFAGVREVDLPGFDANGCLPPLHVQSGREVAAPYRVSEETLLRVFAFNDWRRERVESFAQYRHYLRRRAIQGVAWIGGSFATLKERPSDIDVTVFFQAPFGPFPWHSDKTSCRPTLLSRADTKEKFGCDVFFVDFRADPLRFARAVGLWHGHFSGNTLGAHRGFLEVAL